MMNERGALIIAVSGAIVLVLVAAGADNEKRPAAALAHGAAGSGKRG